MEMLRIVDGVQEYPYSIDKLRKAFRNVSFPIELSSDLKTEYGLFDVEKAAGSSTPVPNVFCEVLVETDPELVDGVYKQKFVVERLSDELAETNIRRTRDALLQRTDYMALSDVTMSDEWKDYRQALRAIPQQANFPTDFVKLPDAPDAITFPEGRPDQPDETE